MSVESHPLRITERDVLKEVSLEDWFSSFKGLDLHIRVSLAVQLCSTTCNTNSDTSVLAYCLTAVCHQQVLDRLAPTAWFISILSAYMQVQCARDLPAETRVGLPDPYCKIICGPAIHRTATQRRSAPSITVDALCVSCSCSGGPAQPATANEAAFLQL